MDFFVGVDGGDSLTRSVAVRPGGAPGVDQPAELLQFLMAQGMTDLDGTPVTTCALPTWQARGVIGWLDVIGQQSRPPTGTAGSVQVRVGQPGTRG